MDLHEWLVSGLLYGIVHATNIRDVLPCLTLDVNASSNAEVEIEASAPGLEIQHIQGNILTTEITETGCT